MATIASEPSIQLLPLGTGWTTFHPDQSTRSYPDPASAFAGEPVVGLIAMPPSWCWHACWRFPEMPEDELREAIELRLEQSFGSDPASLNRWWSHEKDGEEMRASIWVVTPPGSKALAELERQDHLPARVVPWAEIAAASLPENGRSILLTGPVEGEVLMLVVCNGACERVGRVGESEPLAVMRLLVEWEFSGFDSHGCPLILDSALETWAAALPPDWIAGATRKDIIGRLEAIPKVDLTPPAWNARREQVLKNARRKKQILTGAGVYVLMLALLSGWAWWSQRQATILTRRAETLGPALEEVAAMSRAWTQFEPFLSTERQPVELLSQIAVAAKADSGFKLTRYLQQGGEITLDGETPDVALFYEFVRALKESPAMLGATIEPGEPVSGSDGRWNFRIFATWNRTEAAG